MEIDVWKWILIAAAVVIFRFGMMYGRMSRQAEDIQPIPTTRISPEARAKIDDALRRKAKIEAIKLLREDTGCGLAEAKKTVESLEVPRLG